MSHGGELRIEVCHAGAVQEPDGAPIDEPGEGGVLDLDAELVEPDCDRETVVVEEDEDFTLELQE